mmetsp:Transcript_27855/g.52760  ORF Transcript_27855/g.52760 Transcript_27855/m.52760 type:complete len:203 (-) Transcript_27855:1118-1726(-)
MILQISCTIFFCTLSLMSPNLVLISLKMNLPLLDLSAAFPKKTLSTPLNAPGPSSIHSFSSSIPQPSIMSLVICQQKNLPLPLRGMMVSNILSALVLVEVSVAFSSLRIMSEMFAPITSINRRPLLGSSLMVPSSSLKYNLYLSMPPLSMWQVAKNLPLGVSSFIPSKLDIRALNFFVSSAFLGRGGMPPRASHVQTLLARR